MYFKDPERKAQAVIIWLHGLGANPQDMEGLSQELGLSQPVRHIYLSAPTRAVTLNQGIEMPAWYDIFGLNLEDRDDIEGILASTAMLHQVIYQQLAQGFVSQQVFIAGFSQGAALALYAGLSFPHSLGGILALSGYLPGQASLKPVQEKNIPIFFAVGRYDDVVYPQWTKQGVEKIREMGFVQLQECEYPMGHMVCPQEIRDISAWLNTHLA